MISSIHLFRSEFYFALCISGLKIINYIGVNFIGISGLSSIAILLVTLPRINELIHKNVNIKYIKYVVIFLFTYLMGYFGGVDSQQEAFFNLLPMVLISVVGYLKLRSSSYFNLSLFSLYILFFASSYFLITLSTGQIENRLEMGNQLGFGPIFLSRLGCLVFILSIFTLKNRYIKIYGIMIGLYLIQYGASRGPVIFTLLTILYLLFQQKKIARNFSAFFVLMILVTFAFFFKGSSLEERFSELFGSGIEETTRFFRYIVFLNSLPQIPFLGYGSLGWGREIWFKTDTSFSHNLIIDFIVEFGVIGIYLILNLFVRLRSVLKNSANTIYLLFPILFTLTSGNFLTNVELWIALAVLWNRNDYAISR